MVGALDESGAVVVEGLLNPDLLDRFNAELDPLLESTRPDHDRAFVNPAIAWFFGEHHAPCHGHRRQVFGVCGRDIDPFNPYGCE